jgi:predicted transposase/invertase (TIGR01784 family)
MSAYKPSAHKPHDRFFKLIFSDIPRAVDFIRGSLKGDLKEKIDYTSLELDTSSYVDERLKEVYSDLVFRARLQGEEGKWVKVVFLLEHKSFVPHYPHVQLLRYMLGIWERQIQAKEALTPVIAILVYHGQAAWEASDFEADFGKMDPEIRRRVPLFEYDFVNLHTLGLPEIEAAYTDEVARPAIRLMKFIFSPEAEAQWEAILRYFLFEETDRLEQRKRIMRIFMNYVFSGSNILKKTLMEQKSMLEEWGFVEGSAAHIVYEEGRETTLEENVVKLLSKGMSVEQAAHWLELPPEKVKAIAEKYGFA